MTTTILVPLTEEQMEALHPILMGMEVGGMLIAQIYGDGFRAKALTHAEAKKLVQAMGGDVNAPSITRHSTRTKQLQHARRW